MIAFCHPPYAGFPLGILVSLPKYSHASNTLYAAVRGETAVDVKAGDTVLNVVMGLEVENYIKLVEEKSVKKVLVQRKPAVKKKTTSRKTQTPKICTKPGEGVGPFQIGTNP